MSRIDKLIADNPILKTTIAEIIVNVDPTSTYKYVDFLMKQLKTNKASDLESLSRILFGNDSLEILNEFENHCKANRIKNNDISKYSNFKSLQESNKLAEEVLKMKELEKEVNKIYEDDEWLLLIPITFESCKLYGKNTKWCITNKDYWENYKNYKKIFIINKIKDIKFAIVQDKNTIRSYNQLDREINLLMCEFNDNLWLFLRKEFKKEVAESLFDSLISYDKNNGRYILVNGQIRDIETCTDSQIKVFKAKYSVFRNDVYWDKIETFITTYCNNIIKTIINNGKVKV